MASARLAAKAWAGCTGSSTGNPWTATADPEDIEHLYRISKLNDGTTICGMGDAAGYATIGILNKYRDEFEYYIEHRRSRFDGNLEVVGHA